MSCLFTNCQLPYLYPIKRMFAKKVLTRKIMTLHGNTQDLMFVCKCLCDSGKKNQIAAPNFYANCEETMGKITSLMEKKWKILMLVKEIQRLFDKNEA